MISYSQAAAEPGDPVGLAASVAARLAELGARYDAAPVFPSESMRCLAATGLHRHFAPSAGGGIAFDDVDTQYRTLMEVLRIIGRAT